MSKTRLLRRRGQMTNPVPPVLFSVALWVVADLMSRDCDRRLDEQEPENPPIVGL